MQEEIWKDVIGLENGYMISNLGRIKSKQRVVDYGCKQALRPERILGLREGKYGYLYTNLSFNKVRKTVKPHRLVAQMFIENPDNKPCVNHINGIKSDNTLKNLEWCTYAENTEHAHKTGLKKGIKGEKSHLSKLTKENVEEIRLKYLKGNISQEKLGEYYNVSQSQIYRIVNKINW
jgi:hypothetical protein